ncbi:MAG: HD domain-containing protein [Spirochaetaceae bacterium]|nr:HD domain-containing protein [Spirochaetaceae bacterium]
MLTKQLALKIFEAFSIQRWNDLVRPFDLVEMDKAAEKMVLAYILGKFEEQAGNSIDWDWMIHTALFDLLKKIALCDIKSPVQRMIRREYPDEYCRLNQWVIEQYRTLLGESELFKKFNDYCLYDTSEADPVIARTSHVLRAAHKYSTLREFQMLSVVNERFRLEKIEKELNKDIESHLDLRGLQLLLTKQCPYDFLMIIEQLRFQVRWNQTPRVPNTSVLGHSFFVAILTLLLEENTDVVFCPTRRYNNFFAALFHDLPEAVTRDIISPVKQATDDLPSIVKHIEEKIVAKELVPLMDVCFKDELLYLIEDEFADKIRVPHHDSLLVSKIIEKFKGKTAGELMNVSFEEINEFYNFPECSPTDGGLIRVCDHIAAFLEADSSIRHGITSAHLQDGRTNLLRIYPTGKIVSGIDVASFFAEFY